MDREADALAASIVRKSLEVRLALGEYLWVEMEETEIFRPILTAPGVGVHVDAFDVQSRGVVGELIEFLVARGADEHLALIGETPLPVRQPFPRSVDIPFASNFRVRQPFAGPEMQQGFILILRRGWGVKSKSAHRQLILTFPQPGKTHFTSAVSDLRHRVERQHFHAIAKAHLKTQPQQVLTGNALHPTDAECQIAIGRFHIKGDATVRREGNHQLLAIEGYIFEGKLHRART